MAFTQFKSFHAAVLFLLSSHALFSQGLVKPVALYKEAWQESNTKTRMAILDSFWTAESVYEDPATTAKGGIAFKKMIDRFWQDFPGASFEMGTVLSKGNFHTWEWKLLDSTGKGILTGVDVAETNHKGRMLHLVGFWNPPGQTNGEVVKTYYESLFKKQDFSTIEKIISPGAMYHQAVGLPYGGIYRGFVEWMEMYRKAATYFSLSIEREPTYFFNEPDNQVVMQFTIRCISNKTGETITMPISEQFEIKNGRIVSIRPFYFDTQSFSAFLGR